VGVERSGHQRRWFDDVFVTAGMGYPFRYGINSMLLNNRGQKILRRRIPVGHRAAAAMAAQTDFR